MNRSPFLTALYHPVNLTMLALTIVSGLCAAWWLAPIGLGFWLVMLVTISRDPGLQLAFTRQNRQPLAQRYQVRFDRLDRARISIFNTMSQAKSGIQKAVQPVQAALDELVERTYQISQRMSALDNHYAVQRLSNNFKDEIEALKLKAMQTTDETTRKNYEETLRSMEQRQNQLKALSELLDRFEAQLTGTNNAVDSVVTGVVSLKGGSVEYAQGRISSILEIIKTENEEITQFDKQSQTYSIV